MMTKLLSLLRGNKVHLLAQLTVPARLDQLELVGEWLAANVSRMPYPTEPTFDHALQLAVHELLVNIVEHAYADAHGTVDIELHYDKRAVYVRLVDEGRSFDKNSVAAPQLGSLQERGFGLFLVQELCDDLQYGREKAQNVWQISKNLEQS